jgi:cytoskeletal protein CcmA (bactofilin family)
VLTIGPQAELSAEITARGLIVEGNLNGNVAATERFEIRPGGRMKGDVTCPNVIMSEGAEFTGRVDMRRRFGKNEGAPAEGDRRSSA